MLPDYPNKRNPRAFWFSRNDQELAIGRLIRHKRAEARPVTWSTAKRTFSSWVVYFVAVLYVVFELPKRLRLTLFADMPVRKWILKGQDYSLCLCLEINWVWIVPSIANPLLLHETGIVLATYGYNYFGLFLKSLTSSDGTKRWTTEQVNLIPIGGGAINMVFVWVWAILSDLLQTRWTLILAQGELPETFCSIVCLPIAGVIGLIPCIIMSIWTSHPAAVPISAAYASYFINYLCLGTAPLIMAWIADL